MNNPKQILWKFSQANQPVNTVCSIKVLKSSWNPIHVQEKPHKPTRPDKKSNRTLNFSWSILHSWNPCKFAQPFAKKLLHKISILTTYSQIKCPYYQRKKDRKHVPIHHNSNSSLSMLLTTNKFSSNVDDDKSPIHVETAENDDSSHHKSCTVRPGGKDCFSLSALSVSNTHKV